MGRLHGVEAPGGGVADERRRVERVEAAEEGRLGDHAAEGGAGDGGAAEVGERGEADQNFREDIVAEARRHRATEAAVRGGEGGGLFTGLMLDVEGR